jgi:hypothetical protein
MQDDGSGSILVDHDIGERVVNISEAGKHPTPDMKADITCANAKEPMKLHALIPMLVRTWGVVVTCRSNSADR